MGADRQGERTPRRRRALIRRAAAALAVVAAVLALLPPPRIALPAGPLDPRSVAGAIHVHSTRSDGGGSPDEIAAAAAAAGLQFVVLTDHGDGTRTPDPPRYLSGVLVLDGVEIRTAGGHYLALDMAASAYPLGGEPADVAEDVARLGGLGIVAHPASPKGELAWKDWQVAFEGVEWLNVDAEWRDEAWTTLVRAATTFFVRPAPSIALVFDRPVRLLARLDELGDDRDILLVAGADAHGGIGREGGRRFPAPSYESVFRTLSTRLSLRSAIAGDPERDRALIFEALRSRRAFTAVDGLAGPASLTFTARTEKGRAEMGGSLAPGLPVTFQARADGPEQCTILLLRDGEVEASAPVPSLEYVADGAPAVYRIEVHLPNEPGNPAVPWLLSNAISVRAPTAGQTGSAPAEPVRIVLFEPGDRSQWRAEQDPTSHAELSAGAGEGALFFEYSLGLNEAASPFAAIVRDLPAGLAACDTVALTLSSPRPSRVSVQLREPGGSRPSEGRRWYRSVYVDHQPRAIVLKLADLRPAPGAGRAHPEAAAVRALLVVADLVNARPGERGELRVHRAGCL